MLVRGAKKAIDCLRKLLALSMFDGNDDSKRYDKSYPKVTSEMMDQTIVWV